MAKKFRQQGNRFSDEMLTSVDITPSDDLTELFSESSDPRFIRGSLSRWQPDELIASELEYDEDFFGRPRSLTRMRMIPGNICLCADNCQGRRRCLLSDLQYPGEKRFLR